MPAATPRERFTPGKRGPPAEPSVPAGGEYQHLRATSPRHYSNGWTDRPLVTTPRGFDYSLGGWLRHWRVALVRNRAGVRTDFSRVTRCLG